MTFINNKNSAYRSTIKQARPASAKIKESSVGRMLRLQQLQNAARSSVLAAPKPKVEDPRTSVKVPHASITLGPKQPISSEIITAWLLQGQSPKAGFPQ